MDFFFTSRPLCRGNKYAGVYNLQRKWNWYKVSDAVTRAVGITCHKMQQWIWVAFQRGSHRFPPNSFMTVKSKEVDRFGNVCCRPCPVGGAVFGARGVFPTEKAQTPAKNIFKSTISVPSILQLFNNDIIHYNKKQRQQTPTNLPNNNFRSDFRSYMATFRNSSINTQHFFFYNNRNRFPVSRRTPFSGNSTSERFEWWKLFHIYPQ